MGCARARGMRSTKFHDLVVANSRYVHVNGGTGNLLRGKLCSGNGATTPERTASPRAHPGCSGLCRQCTMGEQVCRTRVNRNWQCYKLDALAGQSCTGVS